MRDTLYSTRSYPCPSCQRGSRARGWRWKGKGGYGSMVRPHLSPANVEAGTWISPLDGEMMSSDVDGAPVERRR